MATKIGKNPNVWWEVFPRYGTEYNRHQKDQPRDNIEGLKVFMTYEEAKGYILTELIAMQAKPKRPTDTCFILRQVSVESQYTETLDLGFLEEIVKRPSYDMPDIKSSGDIL